MPSKRRIEKQKLYFQNKAKKELAQRYEDIVKNGCPDCYKNYIENYSSRNTNICKTCKGRLF